MNIEIENFLIRGQESDPIKFQFFLFEVWNPKNIFGKSTYAYTEIATIYREFNSK